MIRKRLAPLLAAAARLGALPGDSAEMRLVKSLLVLAALMFIAAGVAWWAMYTAFGEPLAGLIPLGYAVVSSLSLAAYAVNRRYRLFVFLQLLLILLLPFLLMLALGGYILGSAVIVWSVLAPLGALLLDEPRRARGWWLAFVATVVVAGLLEPLGRTANNLGPERVRLLFVLNVATVFSLAFVLLYSFVRQRDALHRSLQAEQQRAENLLLNILPAEVAQVLKHEERTIADHFAQASILFADMVGFTPLTAALAPAEMVGLLNEVFTHFDELVERFDLEKIRTIGDSYMVASGVPRPRADHAQALACLALEMQRFVCNSPACVERGLNFRIGLNSGPVVAGVIGRKKFIYDLWGDAVNTASRMESHSLPGCIQVTGATYELLKDDFECRPRGPIEVKGKGTMETWYLVDYGPRLKTQLRAAGAAAQVNAG
jgi:guanylate cyclase